MNTLHEEQISCPYCGEWMTVLIDCSVEEQEYIEDCQVCCSPITFKVLSQEGEAHLVTVFHENDV